MRTLKKTLCLVLCLAMMVGLCAFGASAKEFTDADEIKNKEAVDLLDGLGIIEGYPDGSYDPTKIFNRAEAAKIIAYLLLGGDAAESLPKANTQFTDVPASHWASSFINYCASQGIVNGIGHDLFNPTGELTAAAWGKMLLCALGYNAEVEGMTGSDWEFNVTRLVAKTKLADGMAFTAKTPMSRDDAALLAFNALAVPMVEYEGGVNVTTGDGTSVTVDSTVGTTGEFLAEKYNLKVADNKETKNEFDKGTITSFVTGVITANGANTADATVTTLDDGNTYKIETGAELLGHFVKVYCQDNKADKAISVVEIGSTVTVAKAIKDDAAKVTKAFGKKDISAAKIIVFNPTTNGKDAANPAADKKNAAAGEYVFNDENKLVAFIAADYVEVTLDQVVELGTTAGKETVSFNGAGVQQNNATTDVVREYDGIAKEDYVIVSKMGDILTLTKAEVVEGSISKVASDGTITLDGVAYADATAANKTGLAVDVPTKAEEMKKNTYKLFVDAEGNYYACVIVEGEASVSTAMYVTATYKKLVQGDKGDTEQFFALAVDATGAEQSFRIAKTTDVEAGKLYTFTAGNTGVYTAKSVDKDVALTSVKAEAYSGKADLAELKSTDKSIALDAGKAYLTASTNYIFITGMDQVATKGAAAVKLETKTGGVNFKSAKLAEAKFLYSIDNTTDKNMVVKAVFIGDKFEDAGIDASTLLYFAAAGEWDETTTDGFTYTVYDAVTGEKKTVTNIADIDGAGVGFHAFKMKGENYDIAYAIEADSANIKTGKIIDGKYNTSIRFTDDYTVDYDCSAAKIIDVRTAKELGDNAAVASIDALVKAKADVQVDVLVNKGAISIIFVRAK